MKPVPETGFYTIRRGLACQGSWAFCIVVFPTESLRNLLHRLDQLKVPATLGGHHGAVSLVVDDGPQEEITSSLRELEIVINSSLT